MIIRNHSLRIHYTRQGNKKGVPLIFLHAFPFNHSQWLPQLKVLPKDIFAVSYDLRGLGRSSVTGGQYTLEFFVDDLVLLLDRLKISQAVLCGLSMGGYIALRAVERHPDRIKGLVLCDTRAESDNNLTKLKRTEALKVLKEKGLRAFAESFSKAIFAPKTFIKNPRLIHQTKALIQTNSPLGVAGGILALASRTDTSENLSKIKVPTLIMVGAFDQTTPPAASRLMHEKIKHSQLEIIPDAAHMSNLENPEEFNRHLLQFLEKF